MVRRPLFPHAGALLGRRGLDRPDPLHDRRHHAGRAAKPRRARPARASAASHPPSPAARPQTPPRPCWRRRRPDAATEETTEGAAKGGGPKQKRAAASTSQAIERPGVDAGTNETRSPRHHHFARPVDGGAGTRRTGSAARASHRGRGRHRGARRVGVSLIVSGGGGAGGSGGGGGGGGNGVRQRGVAGAVEKTLHAGTAEAAVDVKVSTGERVCAPADPLGTGGFELRQRHRDDGVGRARRPRVGSGVPAGLRRTDGLRVPRSEPFQR